MRKKKINCILITAMSKAYDTIDHFTLLTKLEYYGIRGPALEIFTSYLTDRRQFVQIDTRCSRLRKSLDCSVIQGSKLSGLLYTLYPNDIPLLHTLMEKEIYIKLTKQDRVTTNDTDHTTVNFVDDSTNIISTLDTKTIKQYLDKFYNLLEAVYNINKLKINKDKTELLIICKQKYRKDTKNIRMTASGHKVKQVSKAKILGYTLSNDLKHDKHISALTANINNRLYNIRKISQNSTIKARNILTKAIVIGKINYCLPLLCNARKAEIIDLNTLITKSCRTIMGSRCPRWTNQRLLNRCNMPTIQQNINSQALNYIHRLQSTRTLIALFNIYKLPDRPQRTNQLLYPLYEPKTKLLKASIFFNYSQIYNQLPIALKVLPRLKFKKQIKIHIKNNYEYYTIPNNDIKGPEDSDLNK